MNLNRMLWLEPGICQRPLLKAATAKGIPVLLQEQKFVCGNHQQTAFQKASKICGIWRMEKFFFRLKNYINRNPVRQDLKDVASKRSDFTYFKLKPHKKTILLLVAAGCPNH